MARNSPPLQVAPPPPPPPSAGNGQSVEPVASAEAAAARRPWTSYKEKVRHLSDRIVAAQRDIRVLEAVRWDDEAEEAVVKSRFRELPKVGPEWYRDKR